MPPCEMLGFRTGQPMPVYAFNNMLSYMTISYIIHMNTAHPSKNVIMIKLKHFKRKYGIEDADVILFFEF